MTKKKVIDKYEMGIYPRTLWVCKNVTNEDINKKFEVKDPTKIDVSYTFAWLCIDKRTGNYGYIVNISDYTLKRKDMSEIIKDISHESEHVKIMLFDEIGQEETYNGQEASAYLVGWVASKVYKTFKK